MEISKYFLNLLKSIDYHVGHLPRDLFANEEQLPELSPIFTWFVNNVTPTSNCVTPKELTLFTAISSKHENYSSLEKVSKAINSFYDENTKDSTVSSLDLETLERNILKSQQELNDLKSYGILFEKKIQLVDSEISLLKQQEDSISVSCNDAENNLYSTLNKFTDQVDSLGFSINKLHDQVTSSMTDDNVCYTKLASINLVNLTGAWRQQIFKMINVWFEEENNSFMTNDICSKKRHTLDLLSQSVTALRVAEINEKNEIAQLKIAITNILNMKNNLINVENLFSNELDITNYITKYLKHHEILASSEQSTSSEYEDLQSRLSDFLVANAKSKFSELKVINNRITFIQDSIEHYIMINDVLWCLMRTSCSMANFKCELVLHCINFLENTLYDINNILEWTSNKLEADAMQLNTEQIKNTSICAKVVNFNGYKRYTSIYTNRDEIENLSKMVQSWKSKYHYSREECNKLATLQQKLQVYSDKVSNLTCKYSNAM